MNSAYAVGATFSLENLVSPEIVKIAGQLEGLADIVEDTKVALNSLIPKSLIEKVNALGLSFDKLGPAAEKAASGMIVAMDRAEIGMAKSGDALRLGYDATFVGMDAAADKAASGMITAMARAEAGMEKSATAMKGSVGGVFAGMDVGLSAATDVITHEFSRITRSAGRSSRAIGKLRGELALLSPMSSMPFPQLPGMGGGGGGMGPRAARGHGTGGGANGFHVAPESMNTPMGRVSGHGWAGAAIAGAAIVGDAVFTAAELEDYVTKVIITSQLQPGEQPLTKNKDGQKIKELVQKGAIISGFSQEKVGEMFLGTEREFQGMTFDKKMDTMSALLPAIAAEAHLRHESLEEAGVSLVGVLHQAGLFSQDEMLKGAKEFQFTTMATPVGLGQFKNALSYTMTPLHNGIGMDTGTIMLLTSLMQSAGISNSKAGTWSRQMFVEAEPSTDVLGPLTKTQAQHNKALGMLGLLGEDGKQNWKVSGEDGKTDWNASVIKMFRELHEGMDKIPEGERADVLHRAFGTQGAGAATLFSQPNITDQLEILVPKLKAFQGGEVSLQEYSQGSTIQQSRIAMQEFQVLMADLGTKILPGVNAILKEVSGDLRALPEDWEKTKKVWGDRLHFLAHPFGGEAPAPVPFKLPGAEDGLMQLNAYHTNLDGSPLNGSSGGVSDATQALEDVIYKGMLHALVDFGQKGSADGLQAASYGGSGFGGGGGGGGSGSGAGGARNMRYGVGGHSPGVNLAGGSATGEHADYIRELAKKYGIDPTAAVAVANHEGLHSFVGDNGSSFGDFQLHYGGMAGGGNAVGGMGDDFTRETGLDGKDPKNWKAADDWAMKKAAAGGWGPWHGAAAIGLHGMAGIGGRATGAADLTGGAFTGSSPGDTVGLAMSMLGAGEGAAASRLKHHMSPGEWCADFVNGVIEATGGEGTKSAMANSFSRWGQHVDIGNVKRGDVIEETHGGNTPVHHAGIATGEIQRDAAGNITGIGMVSGNYGHMVKQNMEPVGLVGDLRRASPPPVAAYRPNAPSTAAPGSPAAEPQVHEHKIQVMLDGKAVGKAAYKHFASTGRFPNAMGGPDHHSHYTSPGTPVTDAA